MSLKADGGGDFPESVNQALHEAVTKITWSKDKKALKIIFLVGDAPPHMDYPDDVKYEETCQLAVKKDIIINTIQCGDHAETRKYWEHICRLAEGRYVRIDSRGGPVVVVETPFDKQLAKLNAELAASTLVYGPGGKSKELALKRLEEAAKLPESSAADRAGFAGRSGIAASYDLLDGLKAGKVDLEKLKKDELPDVMQKMTLPEQRRYLEQLDKKRQDLLKQAAELDKKRAAFIAQKLAGDKKKQARDSFDAQVFHLLQDQARRIDVHYGTAEKKK
jgi:hypothetical protein